jgi:hypothetical protein
MQDTLKVLAIGNSFSQDAFYYLQDLAVAGGYKLYNLNLYVGGCSLERHWCNLVEGTKYDAQFLSKEAVGKLTIDEALDLQDWDIISLQQASGFSGVYESYHPYLQKLIDHIRLKLPNTKLWWHQTWAYEVDSTHPHFEKYGYDQETMWDGILKSSRKMYMFGFDEIVPSGLAVQNLRKEKFFDYPNGGMSVCRDGFHMNLVYGRLLVASVWYEKLFGANILSNDYMPMPLGIEVVDEEAISIVKRVAHDTVKSLKHIPDHVRKLRPEYRQDIEI